MRENKRVSKKVSFLLTGLFFLAHSFYFYKIQFHYVELYYNNELRVKSFLNYCIPTFFVLVGLEAVYYTLIRKQKVYRVNDAITNISFGSIFVLFSGLSSKVFLLKIIPYISLLNFFIYYLQLKFKNRIFIYK